MAGVRRVTRSILRYVYPLYVVAIILQVYFAGEGIFGAGDSSIEDANALNLHRDFGWFISQPIALLLLIVLGGAAFLEFWSEALRRRAILRIAVLFGRHLGDDRQVGHRADGVDGRADLVEVAKGFEDEQIDPAREKGFGLLAEVVACLVHAGLAPGLDPDAQRSD